MVNSHRKITLLLSLCVLLFGCDSDVHKARVNTTKISTLIVNNGVEVESLDPHKVSGIPEADVLRQLFEGLVVTGKESNIAPGVAEAWTHQNFKKWIFKLRQNAQWSNGDPVTAQDFVYSWRRLVNPKTGSPYASYLADLGVVNAKAISDGHLPIEKLGIRAIDSYTLEVDLLSSVPYFADALVHSSVLPVHQATVEKYGDMWTHVGTFVGNGAYHLKDWQVNQKILIEKNENYWNASHTQIQAVEILPIQSEETDVSRYQAGEIDMTSTALPAGTFEQLKQKYGSELTAKPALCTYYYEFNTQRPPFNDVRVRRALSLALDRDILTGKILGQGQPPAYGFLPSFIKNYQPNLPDWAKWPQEKRISEAKKLLREAGYSEARPLEATLLYNTSENNKKIAVAAVAMWQQSLGVVNIHIDNKEWKIHQEARRKGDYQIARASWCGDYNEPSSFLNILKTGNAYNRSKYSNPIFDHWMSQAFLPKLSEQERMSAYHQAEEQINQDMCSSHDLT